MDSRRDAANHNYNRWQLSFLFYLLLLKIYHSSKINSNANGFNHQRQHEVAKGLNVGL